jgi:hypothetical protein
MHVPDRETGIFFTFDSQCLSFSQDTLLTSKLIQMWMAMEGRKERGLGTIIIIIIIITRLLNFNALWLVA